MKKKKEKTEEKLAFLFFRKGLTTVTLWLVLAAVISFPVGLVAPLISTGFRTVLECLLGAVAIINIVLAYRDNEAKRRWIWILLSLSVLMALYERIAFSPLLLPVPFIATWLIGAFMSNTKQLFYLMCTCGLALYAFCFCDLQGLQAFSIGVTIAAVYVCSKQLQKSALLLEIAKNFGTDPMQIPKFLSGEALEIISIMLAMEMVIFYIFNLFY